MDIPRLLYGCQVQANVLNPLISTPDNPITLNSPNANLEFSFWLSDSVMTYKVAYTKNCIILPSSLGLNLKDKFGWKIPDWKEGMIYKNHNYAVNNTNWKPLYGERASIRDNYRELVIELIYSADTLATLLLEVRAYDSGIAFRYIFPEQIKLQGMEIEEELTTFTFPEDTMGWFTNRAQGEYELLSVNDFESAGERPLTLEFSDKTFVSITEAQMIHFSRMRLKRHPDKENTLITTLDSPVE